MLGSWHALQRSKQANSASQFLTYNASAHGAVQLSENGAVLQGAGVIKACVPAGGTSTMPMTARVEFVHSYLAHLARAAVHATSALQGTQAREAEQRFFAHLPTSSETHDGAPHTHPMSGDSA